MHISHLHIVNFRGLKEARIEDPGRLIVIAGQNGSGKSCVFDAIRILKSAYGGYQPNELQNWLSEFQIRLSNAAAEPSDFRAMFYDPSLPAHIECEFVLAQEEKEYLREHGLALLRNAMSKAGGAAGVMPQSSSPFLDPNATSERDLAAFVATLEEELLQQSLSARLEFNPGKLPEIVSSPALSAVFSNYRLGAIGVVDYHGAHRHYGREHVQNVNFDLADTATRQSQSALYNLAAKYSNIKGELAASYVREVLAREAGEAHSSHLRLTETLSDLFKTFFPDKRFLGPTPTPSGGLAFNVELSSGHRHDIDDLSSGEKEIIYGYLRMRNSAPSNSIILIDEPELHLNPKLVRDLPAFYRRHLADEANNQIWLVTHSDALIRGVIGVSGYNVLHMLPAANTPPGENQLKPIGLREEIDAALIDLVGDLAAYHPSGKVVLFEGGGDSNFDCTLVSSLFPELAKVATLIPATSKSKVSALHEVLSQKNSLPYTFYSITDADGNYDDVGGAIRSFKWDVYHIENYLLAPKFIQSALRYIGAQNVPEESQIVDMLKACAQSIYPEILQHQIGSFANRVLVDQIKTRCSPASTDIAGEVHAAVARSFARLQEAERNELTKEALFRKQEEVVAELDASIGDGTWLSKFPGRSILKRFVSSHVKGMNYDSFIAVLRNRMTDAAYKPPGMARIVAKIVEP